MYWQILQYAFQDGALSRAILSEGRSLADPGNGGSVPYERGRFVPSEQRCDATASADALTSGVTLAMQAA